MWLTYLLLAGAIACAAYAITVAVLNRSNLWQTIRSAIGQQENGQKAVIRKIIQENGKKKVTIDVLDDGGEKNCEVEASAETVYGIYEEDVIHA